jgi:hypothetical protein
VRVLIACERSGKVRDAFLRLGVDAMSCDLAPTDVPGPHYQGDVTNILMDQWDLMICHPPCTHLATSGAGYFKYKEQEQWDAIQFVRMFLSCDIPHICLENPVSVISSQVRPPDQVIHPWMFGHPEQKTTCLWLKNLPPLNETNNVRKSMRALPDKQRQRLRYLSPSKDRSRIRSETYLGIADAMALQWTSFFYTQCVQ